MKKQDRKILALSAVGGNLKIEGLSAYTINNLSAYTINNLSAYTINNLSADTINNLSADTINNLSAYTINNLSANTINNLSAYTIKNLSAYTIKNLSADTINNLSAYTINNLSADTINNLKIYQDLFEALPVLVKPYTSLLADINDKKRIHDQSTFGDIEEFDPEANVCGTRMCTAGHFVNMAGEVGYKAQNIFGWEKAAAMICLKAHPDFPIQNFGGISQKSALAFIEEMADLEASGLTVKEWLES